MAIFRINSPTMIIPNPERLSHCRHRFYPLHKKERYSRRRQVVPIVLVEQKLLDWHRWSTDRLTFSCKADTFDSKRYSITAADIARQ